MNKLLSIINLLAVFAIIYWNYYTIAVGFNGNDVGSLSDKYGNLFTPASYAFSIWGVIFLSLIAITVFMVKTAWSEKKESTWLPNIGWSLLIANIGNGIWTWAWLSEMTGLSVCIMFIILLSLLYALHQTIQQPVHRWLVRLPIALYTGWISVAITANIAAHLNQFEWHPLLGEINWTLLMIVTATLINIYVVKWKGVNAFGAVGAWALLAISLKHWELIPIIQWTALAGFAAIVLSIIKSLIPKIKSV